MQIQKGDEHIIDLAEHAYEYARVVVRHQVKEELVSTIRMVVDDGCDAVDGTGTCVGFGAGTVVVSSDGTGAHSWGRDRSDIEESGTAEYGQRC